MKNILDRKKNWKTMRTICLIKTVFLQISMDDFDLSEEFSNLKAAVRLFNVKLDDTEKI